MSENNVITIRGLTKDYGKVQALRGVDLEVQSGEIFGFLGPNGAGKTTTIRCLLDLIRPTSGSARVLGINPQSDPVAVQARVGYLPGELSLNNNLTAERQIRFFSDMRGDKIDEAPMRQLARRLNLDLTRPIKNLSKGNKQKIGIVQALMHRPELLLMDEPTSGLDPLMQQEVLALVREAKADGATVFFCSHIMSEVEAVADRVGIIRLGKVVEVAKTTSLVSRALRHATVRFERPVDSAPLEQLPGVKVLSRLDGAELTLQVEGKMDGLIKALAAFPVNDLETVRPSLEEVFLAYYENV
jgi:ABC-2 type transport system ATP-binding protein